MIHLGEEFGASIPAMTTGTERSGQLEVCVGGSHVSLLCGIYREGKGTKKDLMKIGGRTDRAEEGVWRRTGEKIYQVLHYDLCLYL